MCALSTRTKHTNYMYYARLYYGSPISYSIFAYCIVLYACATLTRDEQDSTHIMAPTRMKYVRDIPVPTRQRICEFFDDISGHKNWKYLAGLLGFSNDDISMFGRSMVRPGGSPTDEMLTAWDYENHTIEELYLKLYELRHARCMMLLKELVDPRLHGRIDEITGTAPRLADPPDPEAPQGPGRGPPAHQPSGGFPPGAASHGSQPAMMPAPQPNPHYQYPLQPAFNQAQHQHFPIQQQQQQQQWGAKSNQTASTASFHSDKAHPSFRPVDPRMMMPAISRPLGPSAGPAPNNPSPPTPLRHPSSYNDGHQYHQHHPQQYRHQQPEFGSVNAPLSRLPSEHPLGPPQRYQSQHSNDDNYAPPPIPPTSPESLAMCRPPQFHPTSPPARQDSQPDSVEQCLSATIKVPYEKLCAATENFSAAYRLGAGAFGEVFHAEIDMNHVAIKKIIKNEHVLFNTSMIRKDQIKEIQALTKYRNKNIVSLISYTFGDECLCLIFEFMVNGSLEHQLEGKSRHGPLDWRKRHTIAEGAANGLQYLHKAQSPPLIHQDVKSANILLDENFVAKIADFGLARPGPDSGKEYTTIKTSVVFGTEAYLAPEFIRDSKRKLSTRLDVFSFGVVLMELVTGVKAAQAKERFGHHKLLTRCIDRLMTSNEGNPQKIVEEARDPKCPDWPAQYVLELLELAAKCTEAFKFRPEMGKVCETLIELGVRVKQENDQSARTHMFPIENTEPLEYRPGMESSDPSVRGGSQEQNGVGTGGPDAYEVQEDSMREMRNGEKYRGLAALESGVRLPEERYDGRGLGAGELYQRQVQERLQELHLGNQDRRREGIQCHDGPMKGGGMPCQFEGYQQYEGAPEGYQQYQGMPVGGWLPQQRVMPSSDIRRHYGPAVAPSTGSPSPASSYPSFQHSTSVTSSSDASAHQQYPQYGGGGGDRYIGSPPAPPPQYQIHPYDPRTQQEGHQGYPQCAGPHNYGHHGYAGSSSQGTDNMNSGGYVQGYGGEPVQGVGGNPRGGEEFGGQVAGNPGKLVAHHSSASNRYTKVPTLNLPPLSLLSSDTSNLTSDTSLPTSSNQGLDSHEDPEGGEGSGQGCGQGCAEQSAGPEQSRAEGGCEGVPVEVSQGGTDSAPVPPDPVKVPSENSEPLSVPT